MIDFAQPLIIGNLGIAGAFDIASLRINSVSSVKRKFTQFRDSNVSFHKNIM